jgi:hypothetical protein
VGVWLDDSELSPERQATADQRPRWPHPSPMQRALAGRPTAGLRLTSGWYLTSAAMKSCAHPACHHGVSAMHSGRHASGLRGAEHGDFMSTDLAKNIRGSSNVPVSIRCVRVGIMVS